MLCTHRFQTPPDIAVVHPCPPTLAGRHTRPRSNPSRVFANLSIREDSARDKSGETWCSWCPLDVPRRNASMHNAHISALNAKHSHLDKRIAAESQRPLPDQILLAQLKKAKLRVKEEMQR
ncbi:YdcH family protein [Sphingomonas pokkalii]|uniref:YdcH family protein n=1 Tax=Sphingomonas pokkalii TaxID=2175090 RepID=UPI003F5DBFFD